MRVLHIIDSLRVGGAEKLLTYFLKYSADYDVFDNTVLTLYDKIEIDDFYNLRKVQYKTLDLKSKYQLSGISRLSSLLKEGYDVIHVHLFPAQYFVSIAKEISKITPLMIFTEHSIYNKRRNYSFFKLLELWTYEKYEKILCVSEQTENFLLEWLPKLRGRTSVIYPGVFIGDYDNQIDKTKIYDLVFVGRLIKSKGIDTLLESLRLIKEKAPKMQLKVAILGKGELDREIISAKEALKDYIEIEYLGLSNDVSTCLKLSKVFVLPSRYEGLPISLLESLAVGTPAIAGKVGGIPEVIEDGVNGILIEPDNPFVLKEAILKILKDDDLRAHFSQSAYKTAKEKFEIKHYFDRLKQIYLSEGFE